MHKPILLSGCCFGFGFYLMGSACADSLQADAEITIVAAALDQDSQVDADAPLHDIALGVEGDTVFDNGLRFGFRLEGRIQKDHERRPSFAGHIGGGVNQAGSSTSIVSAATGVSTSSGHDDEDHFAQIEQGFIYLEGGWGEVSVGRDTGAAVRLDARAPKILDKASVTDTRLDPTGLAMTRARNDVTGISEKLTYLSPRWLGLRVGGSYTPDADVRSVDFDPTGGLENEANPQLEDIFEGGLSFSRKFRSRGIRLRTALTASYATSGNEAAGFIDYEAYGGGLELEKDEWKLGFRTLISNNARQDGDYKALEVGVSREVGKWTLGVESAWSEDKLQDLESTAYSIGARRQVNDMLSLGLAYINSDLSGTHSLSNPEQGIERFGVNRSEGLIFEVSVRKK